MMPEEAGLCLGRSHRDPLYNFYRRNGVCAPPAGELPTDLVISMVWLDPRPDFLGQKLRVGPWNLSTKQASPTGFYTTSSTKAIGVYILYERTGKECILILSPSQDSEQRSHNAPFSPQVPTCPSGPCSLLGST